MAKGNVPCRPAARIEKAGSHLPAQCFSNASRQKGKITRELIAMHSSWKHSGFHVFCGNPDCTEKMNPLWRIWRVTSYEASFSLGTHALSGTQGHLYSKRWQDKQKLPRTGMAGGHVLTHSQSGRADGSLLRILQ